MLLSVTTLMVIAVRTRTADAILAALDPEQVKVAKTFDVPVCVIAGAGTGKTRAVTHRIAYGAATGKLDPRRTLAVTFTTKAAGTMRGRLADLGGCWCAGSHYSFCGVAADQVFLASCI